ncbi:hypothetical protein KY290_001319 [Solanum tuberosum]|uniref:Uncharacterized protein n=1 Tax=Solanum tuberosum TaxID=4113 RepID=A0ABQ7WLX4_SOLTU|nr:hypothetical protein KY290_001319 [Solanum tuberosum]
MLFPFVSYTPKNQNDHASILQSRRYSFALTRSASQAQMKEVVKARTKRRHLGKAPVPPFSLPGWGDLFPDTELLIHKKKLVKFYMNLKVLEENVVTSNVKGVELVFDHSSLGEILHVPTTGLDEYDWPNDEQCLLTSKYSKEGLPPRLRKY